MKINRSNSLWFPLAALMLSAAPVHAEALRCGNHIIKEGDSSLLALKRCGKPLAAETVEQPIFARSVNGGVFRSGTALKTLWYYDRGTQKFPAVLTIVGGAVERIEFLKR